MHHKDKHTSRQEDTNGIFIPKFVYYSEQVKLVDFVKTGVTVPSCIQWGRFSQTTGEKLLTVA